MTGAPTSFDWSPLLKEAGLDQAQLQPVSPTWTPPHEATSRVAWSGSYPSQPDLKFHIEAAAFAGQPVYFQVFHPWSQPVATTTNIVRFRERALVVLLLSVFIIVLLGSALLALRNLKLGRGDRKGAFRLGAFLLAVYFVNWLFTTHARRLRLLHLARRRTIIPRRAAG